MTFQLKVEGFALAATSLPVYEEGPLYRMLNNHIESDPMIVGGADSGSLPMSTILSGGSSAVIPRGTGMVASALQKAMWAGTMTTRRRDGITAGNGM